ncbi:MAG: hypothetical protein KDJ86_02665 [Bauldia sp.]|uniref:hypothetical protein n=1 Tax=Bauldia sp. TaxID=2575872 RepID=UPI001DC3682F|nr:hypothetical protein [Bauldia sp.]MCB1494663.1 hypothetical protein [Bauldia sp.]
MPDRSSAQRSLVTNRRVVHISGFEPTSIERLDRRMNSGLRRFGSLWGATATVSPCSVAPDQRSATWDIRTTGPNWTTACRYTILRWDELMAPYVERSWLGRMLHGYKALFEFVWTGTLRRYFKANIRYGLFFIYPLLTLAGFVLLGIGAGVLAAWLGMPLGWLGATLVGLVVFGLLMRFLGGYFYLDFALADWACAADLARRDIPGMEDLIGQFAASVIEAIRDPEADEVLLSGVSLGAVMMVEAIARAYRATPGLDKEVGHTAFLTVGSSIMKIGLHPAAKDLRQDVYRVGAEKSLLWIEYQAKVDPINFYKTDPVADLGNPKTGSPIIKMIRIRDMMSAEGYRRAQRGSLHLHRQFVMPNAKRYFYDFYHIGFGPLRLADRVRLGKKAASIFAGDGSYKRKRPAGKSRKAAAIGE